MYWLQYIRREAQGAARVQRAAGQTVLLRANAPLLITPRNAAQPDCWGDCRLAESDLYRGHSTASQVHTTDLVPMSLSNRRNAHRVLQTWPAVGTPQAKSDHTAWSVHVISNDMSERVCKVPHAG